MRDWKHRTRVYKFGILWFWKCDRYTCQHGGRFRELEGAFKAAWNHTSVGGYYPGEEGNSQPLPAVTPSDTPD